MYKKENFIIKHNFKKRKILREKKEKYMIISNFKKCGKITHHRSN
jgi:hypothetical protein